ncbi:unnamed protein product, partial [Coregonus sp. 'balchen']
DATFILQNILDQTGLAYICQTYERFSGNDSWEMVLQLSKEPSTRLLKQVLRDATFAQVLKDDTPTKRWPAHLVKNLQEGPATDGRGIPLTAQ